MKKEFKSESKQLLNLMIHSIYSNKDIFLRELISNASDALDKKEFFKIQSKIKGESESFIEVSIDQKQRVITITDTGIGMDDVELEKNLGTIAHSGSKEFIDMLEEGDKNDIIGQFGVGFYSSFIVADDVLVITRKEDGKGYKWESDGVDSYEISEYDTEIIGTQISLKLKEGDEYNKYLNDLEIKGLIKKHSDYVKYPIKMLEQEKVEDSEDTIDVLKVINSQKAIWKKRKSEVSEEEYNEFYSSKYYDFMPAKRVIHAKSEGTTNMDMLLFIPAQKSFDYLTPNFKKGLDLYCRGVLIDNNVDYLLPDYFNFVKGLIDSEDLSLNISREMLQQDKVVEKIKRAVNTKIKKELLKMQSKKREEYEAFYDEFGRTLMFGIYDQYGVNVEELKDLVMFKSSMEDKYVTLQEYTEKNEEQKIIYYVAGDSIERIKQMPIMEKIKTKNIEVLYFTNDIDEFAIQIMNKYNDFEFKSILNADLDSEEEKEEIEKLASDNKDVLEKIKLSLGDVVKDVRLTNKLDSAAVCIVNDNDISIEQEKILSQMPDSNFKADKILEINPKHDLFKAIEKTDNFDKYSQLLFDQALLIEGLTIDNPQKHAELINNLIIDTLK